MKRILIALMAVIGMGATAMADSNNDGATAENENALTTQQDSNKKLQFTVSKERGKINSSGDTENFYVSLAGDQNVLDKIVSVTVQVRIYDEKTGRVSLITGNNDRKPYVIQAGHHSSDNSYIKIGTKYAGQTYIVKILDYFYNGKRVMAL